METENTTREAALFLEGWMQSESAENDQIKIKRVYIDINQGNIVDGLIFSQIMYWHRPSKKGKSKLTVKRDGHYWLAKAYDNWWDEIRVPARAARDAIKRIKDRGLIVIKVFRFGSKPIVHIRIDMMGFMEALRKLHSDVKRQNGNDVKRQNEVTESGRTYNTENTAETTGSEITIPLSSDPSDSEDSPEPIIPDISPQSDDSHEDTQEGDDDTIKEKESVGQVTPHVGSTPDREGKEPPPSSGSPSPAGYLRNGTGKVHIAALSGLPACGYQGKSLTPVDQPAETDLCKRCLDTLPLNEDEAKMSKQIGYIIKAYILKTSTWITEEKRGTCEGAARNLYKKGFTSDHLPKLWNFWKTTYPYEQAKKAGVKEPHPWGLNWVYDNIAVTLEEDGQKTTPTENGSVSSIPVVTPLQAAYMCDKNYPNGKYVKSEAEILTYRTLPKFQALIGTPEYQAFIETGFKEGLFQVAEAS